MEALWDHIRQRFIQRAALVAERAEHICYVGRVRLDIAYDRRTARSAYTQLGRRVYWLLSDAGEADVGDDPEVRDILERIREREEILREREATLASLVGTGKSEEQASKPVSSNE